MAHVKTSFWLKPIPTNQFDWCAWYDGDEPNDSGQMSTGYGATEMDAIDDLIDNHPSDLTWR
jgi:hypothetical protein